MALPMHRFCNYVYGWCIERIADEEKIEVFHAELTKPLDPTKPLEVTETTAAEEMELFYSGMGG